MKAEPNALTPGEQSIVGILTRHRRLNANQIAELLESTPSSIKVMVCNLRRKGFDIAGGGRGSKSIGYSLKGTAGRGIAPTERDAMVRDLKVWPLVSYNDIAKKYNRSVTTVGRLARVWGLGRHGK